MRRFAQGMVQEKLASRSSDHETLDRPYHCATRVQSSWAAGRVKGTRGAAIFRQIPQRMVNSCVRFDPLSLYFTDSFAQLIGVLSTVFHLVFET